MIRARGTRKTALPPSPLAHCVRPVRGAVRLLQQLGYFLLQAVGLARAEMPVWLRISYLDMLEVAEA